MRICVYAYMRICVYAYMCICVYVYTSDEERSGRPSTSTTDKIIEEVKKLVLANRRITVREVAEDLNISIGTCHSKSIANSLKTTL
uniref:Putative secreted protein n=1 Tax=Xenopsylla cheopis TaxID=163159 RepID=A0A6M2DYM5_XENCH